MKSRLLDVDCGDESRLLPPTHPLPHEEKSGPTICAGISEIDDGDRVDPGFMVKET